MNHKPPWGLIFRRRCCSLEASENFLIALFVACFTVHAAAAPEIKSDESGVQRRGQRSKRMF